MRNGSKQNMLLIVSKLAEEKTGGVQTRIINYAKYLPKFDVKPVILSIGDYNEKVQTTYQSVPLYKFPKKSWPVYLFFILSLIKKHKINVIHVLEGALGFLQIFSLLVGRIKRMKAGISLFGGEMMDVQQLNRPVLKMRLSLTQKLASRIAVNSKATSQFIPKKYKNKICLVYPGVNQNLLEYKTERKSKEGFNLLFVGRIIRRKGIDDIIKALKIVLNKFPNVRLTVVGAGPTSIDTYQKLANELGISDKVEFTGEIKDYKKLAKLYSDCDIFIMTPKLVKYPMGGYESFGCVYLEAALFKKPVIGTRHYGVKEAVIDGKTGLLVEEGNPQDLAQAILKLIKNPDLRKKLGEAGYKRTLAYFKDIDSTRQLTEVYK